MKYKVATEIMLILLLSSMLSLAFNIQPARTEPITWTVDDDGPADFTTIQGAINHADEGDTIFVYDGTYSEPQVTIRKPLQLIGANKSTTIIDGGGSWVCIYVNFTQNVNISGFTVRNGYGIYSYRSENVTISGNTISSNGQGIVILESTSNTIAKNIVTLNSMSILLSGSNSNKVCENIVTLNSGDAIWLDDSHRNIISGNNITKNNEQGTTGISLIHSLGNTIAGNDVLNNYDGIFLGNSSDNTIAGNNITENNFDGISLEWNSSNNTISYNTLAKNMFAIRVGSSFNNTILGNKITENNATGIALYESSSRNTIAGNDIIRNKQGGIWFVSSSNNTIYHNNFVDTTSQAYNENSTNVWDDGYPSGGNYWSDHVCFGNPSDGSHPHIIDENNIDHYPFQDPSGWITPDINGDGIVDILDIVVAGKAFASYPGYPRWDSRADINNDDVIDIFDLILIAMNFGKTV